MVVGSVTAAVRLRRELERASGYPAEVVHTPKALSKGGCSYSVKADDRLENMIGAFCAEKGLSVKRICKARTEGGETVYDDIS